MTAEALWFSQAKKGVKIWNRTLPETSRVRTEEKTYDRNRETL